jgi:hypothetical protein
MKKNCKKIGYPIEFISMPLHSNENKLEREYGNFDKKFQLWKFNSDHYCNLLSCSNQICNA